MNDQPTQQQLAALKPVETWRQHPAEPGLWIGEQGLLVNTAALVERERYYNVVRVPAGDRPAQDLGPEISAGF